MARQRTTDGTWRHGPAWPGVLRMVGVVLVTAGVAAALFSCGAVQGFYSLEDARVAYARGEYNAAAGLYWESAKQGEAEAQYQLGGMYARGEGVEPDTVIAERYMRAAAEQNYPMAMITLGWWYLSGRYVGQDLDKGVSWLRRAAEEGDDVARFMMGLVYKTGTGVEYDHKEANRWFALAEEKGFPVPRLYYVQGSIERSPDDTYFK